MTAFLVLALLAGVALLVVGVPRQASADDASPPDPAEGPPDFAPPQDGTSPALSLPGDNHDYDNQFLYAAGLHTGDPSASSPDTWSFALFLKCVAWREQGRSWTWDCGAHNINPPVEESWGLMQVNVLAHPQYAPAALRDCNTAILAGAELAYPLWLDASGAPERAATSYNVGHWPGASNQYGQDVAGVYHELAAQLPSPGGA